MDIKRVPILTYLNECNFGWTGEKSQNKLDGKPNDAYGFNDEEWFRGRGNLILDNFRYVRGCIVYFVMFKLWKCFQAKDDDWNQYDRDGSYGNDSSCLWGFRMFHQQPNLFLPLNIGQGTFLLLHVPLILTKFIERFFSQIEKSQLFNKHIQRNVCRSP